MIAILVAKPGSAHGLTDPMLMLPSGTVQESPGTFVLPIWRADSSPEIREERHYRFVGVSNLIGSEPAEIWVETETVTYRKSATP